MLIFTTVTVPALGTIVVLRMNDQGLEGWVLKLKYDNGKGDTTVGSEFL